jgi:hypothetical protein
MEQMLEYQKVCFALKKDTIPGPLLNLAPTLHKDAVKCFKLLQKILAAKGEMLESYDKIQELLEKGIRNGSLRDEILVQSIKVLAHLISAIDQKSKTRTNPKRMSIDERFSICISTFQKFGNVFEDIC